MANKYGAEPLRTIQCHLEFGREGKWDWTWAGMIFERLGFNRHFGMQYPRGVEPNNALGFGEKIEEERDIVCLVSDKSRTFVFLGVDLLQIFQLAPGYEWAKFRGAVGDILRAYLEVAKPKGISSLKLIYNNEFGGREIMKDAGKYFKVVAGAVEGEAEIGRALGVNVRLDYLCRDPHGIRSIKFGTDYYSFAPDGESGAEADAEKETFEPKYFLNLESAFVKWSEFEPTADNIAGLLDREHEWIQKAFESCTTDELRKTF